MQRLLHLLILRTTQAMLWMILPAFTFGQSNEGTDFWLGFMEHIDNGSNSKVVMITSKINTSGTVSVPLQNWSAPFSVSANQVTVVNLPSSTENTGSESVDNKGVRVTAQAPVSVYSHQYHDSRSEATVVFPVSSIGNSYYIMTYRGVIWQTSHHPSEFLLVGVKDDTNLNITVADDTRGGKPAGTTFSIQLNAGETYQVQGHFGSDDLTGSFVEGDKDFAVFGGNSWTEVPTGCGARDNLLEQMYPVSTWGKQFVTAPYLNVNFDVFRYLAAEDNTSIQVTGNTTQIYTLNAGEFVEAQHSEATYIQADKPLMVAQFSVGTFCSGHDVGDPSMVILNSIEQTRDTVTLYNSSFENITENYISIITASDNLGTVFIDGQLLTDVASTNTAGINDEFSYARLQVNQGAHTITSGGCGVIAMAYGYGNVESYAYSGGASFNAINANPIPEGGCLSDTLSFDADLPPSRYSFFWDLGDGSFSTEATFDHFYPDLGSYPVELVITDNCLGTVDTVNRDLLITLRQALDATGDVDICQGESFSLTASDVAGATYEWTGPNGYFSEEQFPSFSNAPIDVSGEYAVIGIVSGCATFPSITEAAVHENPNPYLGEDTLFCSREEPFSLYPGSYSNYLWQDNSRDMVFLTSEEGVFWVEVTDINGCIGSDTITLIEVCPTLVYVPNAFTPNYDGINDSFGVYGQDIISMKFTIWSRWGELLFESSSLDFQWDGIVNGKMASPGVYVWMLELEGYREDGTQFQETQGGSVTLIR